MSNSRTQAMVNKVVEAFPEEDKEAIICNYCKKLTVKNERMVCFYRTCIAKHQTANFPPRIRLSTVINNNDGSEEENEDAVDDNSGGEEESIMSDSGTSTRSEYVNESETDLQDEDSLVGNDEDARSECSNISEDLSSTSISSSPSVLLETVIDGDVSSEDESEAQMPMCENCHRRPFFEEDPVVAVTTLTYYFVVEMVDIQTLL